MITAHFRVSSTRKNSELDNILGRASSARGTSEHTYCLRSASISFFDFTVRSDLDSQSSATATATQSCQTSLLSFDVLLKILEKGSTSLMAQCAQLNSRFYTAVQYFLYRSIRLDGLQRLQSFAACVHRFCTTGKTCPTQFCLSPNTC